MTFADPVATLVDLSHDAEMIVVGSRRQSALRRALLGSVSSAVVRKSDCPVAVIHDEDPLMPDPAHAPVLVGIDGSPASVRTTMLGRQEALRRGVAFIVSADPVPRLIEQSEAAQLVVVADHDRRGATVAEAARMPVIVTH